MADPGSPLPQLGVMLPASGMLAFARRGAGLLAAAGPKRALGTSASTPVLAAAPVCSGPALGCRVKEC